MFKKFNISMSEGVYKILKEDSENFGQSVSAYLANLVVQKNLEISAMRFAGSFTAEQLQQALSQQKGGQE